MNAFTKMVFSAMLSLLGVGVANAFETVESQDVHFSGDAEANPCKVTLPSTIDFGPVNVYALPISTIDQPQSSTGQIQTVRVEFQGCMDNQMAQMSILGAEDTVDPTILANTATTDAAKYVGVAFWDATASVKGKYNRLDVNEEMSTSYNVGTSYSGEGASSGTLKLIACLVSSSYAPTPGNVSLSAQFKITYL
ncbi:MAG TPA: fimbrial protein [Scandinavium sp.]|jgi:type 1 fimbria pilin|uniref:fimbrial protein n=1 Tax=Scandinavium sp. TaxID=2830653 RepID=UPI002E369A3E|nr:fimbrial protein [Scandinavium sp.]HEX4503043.1 fimbrial protein [Scandinavium sp.]